jgi:glycosyltransferase involved in cell wall biosynthesis
MKVAIVHEWLVNYGGSERVVEQMLHCFPQADLFATVDFLGGGEREFLQGHAVRTTFIQGLPLARRNYRRYLPLMPLAVKQHDLAGYDVVLSSNHAVAKGVRTRPDQLHLCYCHTPMRYAWELQELYLRQTGLDRGVKGWLARWLLHRLRTWDARTAKGVGAFIANSAYIAQRIRNVYSRSATVIYPPVDIGGFAFKPHKEDFFLVVSRLVPYKRVDLVVEAFAGMPWRSLVVIGDGPEVRRVRAAAGPNVSFLGHLDSLAVRDHMQRARAFIFAGEEDFGIAPVEAQACGTPVIAYGRGGVTESVRGLEHKRPTGVFFPEQTPESIQAAVAEFERERTRIDPWACRERAERFSSERFRREFSAFVGNAWERFKNGETVDVDAQRSEREPPRAAQSAADV